MHVVAHLAEPYQCLVWQLHHVSVAASSAADVVGLRSGCLGWRWLRWVRSLWLLWLCTRLLTRSLGLLLSDLAADHGGGVTNDSEHVVHHLVSASAGGVGRTRLPGGVGTWRSIRLGAGSSCCLWGPSEAAEQVLEIWHWWHLRRALPWSRWPLAARRTSHELRE